MLAAILFALISVPLALPNQATEHVDLIELNHFYDSTGRLVYDQVIFYERAPETGRFQVRAWCLVEDRELFNRRPVKTNRRASTKWIGLISINACDARSRAGSIAKAGRKWIQSEPTSGCMMKDFVSH